ncbi:hypothetical protein F2P81_018781 [Scophthalmus maximus]|uniref:Uncharacterized protein n=1 Tax=Scophthalmus maximus TaxID=52904 RepID=A0A6A4S393_SCOMX|nr:hypothetical protein F2P81_018781 [Scophthalmus maximus]
MEVNVRAEIVDSERGRTKGIVQGEQVKCIGSEQMFQKRLHVHQKKKRVHDQCSIIFESVANRNNLFMDNRQALVGLLNQTGGVSGPGEVLCDVGPQELEAGDTFNSHPVDVNGIVRASSFSPEVHDELLRLAGVEEQVIVSTPSGQMLYLLPVGCLVVVADEANHRRIVRKLDDGVGSMYRSAVVVTTWLT